MDSHLHSHRLAPRKLPQRIYKFHETSGAIEGGVEGGRVAILPDLDASCLGDGFRNLFAGKDSPVPWLGALRQLDFDHLFDLSGQREFGASHQLLLYDTHVGTPSESQRRYASGSGIAAQPTAE